MSAPTTTFELCRRVLAELNVQVRRLPSSGYVAIGPGAPGGRGDLIARDEAEQAGRARGAVPAALCP
jgi:hypothetical protein